MKPLVLTTIALCVALSLSAGAQSVIVVSRSGFMTGLVLNLADLAQHAV